MILIIDNYDSFTYNLVQYLGELVDGMPLEVFRNDAITVEQIKALSPKKIVLSPGPGTPNDAGICLEIIKCLQGSVPLFGVCLGLQVIGQAFGGTIISAKSIMHGKTSAVRHNGCGIFSGVRNPLNVARYHSLVVNPDHVPAALKVTAMSDDGEIMGLKHKVFPIWGVQFHPESILTEDGKMILQNFLKGEDL
ncbi:MAG TPA: aminodeoxychorismate/anthranilate synthase component II [Candidatus Limnocylindrales bacterium]|nr:aminodeoxychorismate/anthranilate synthase component II [Candidatus Limnocylindrales bacterium]